MIQPKNDFGLNAWSAEGQQGTDLPTQFLSAICPQDESFDVLTPDGLRSASELLGPATSRYLPLKLVAEGGMGHVYLAKDEVLNRTVALKVLRAELASRPTLVERFRREARITCQLDHPGVVPVYDTGVLPDGRPFIAMKYLRGRLLGEQLAARQGPAHALPYWLAAVAQLCQLVVYAHARGVIHRDVKPGNILQCGAHQIYLIDWGLARLVGEPPDQPGGADPRVFSPVDLPVTDTADGVLLGTPAFVPPEQAAGRPVDERADVFGLGGVLCVVLTNRPPHAGVSRADVIARARAGDLADAHSRLDASGAHPGLVQLTKQCLAADPADRPRRVTEVLGSLNAVRTAVR